MTREELLESIAETISDYRAGQIPPIDAGHIERWIKQFDKAVLDSILGEMDHVLKETPARLGWQPIMTVEHYRLDAQSIQRAGCAGP